MPYGGGGVVKTKDAEERRNVSGAMSWVGKGEHGQLLSQEGRAPGHR